MGIAQNLAASAAIAEVKAAYVAGAAAIGLATGTVWAWTVEYRATTALEARYQQIGQQILAWSTDLLGYAQAGVGGGGQPYSWEEWSDFGDDLLDQISGNVSFAWNWTTGRTAITRVREVAQTARDVLDKPLSENPIFDLPWYVYTGIAAGGVFVLAYLVNTFRPFFPQRRLAGYRKRR